MTPLNFNDFHKTMSLKICHLCHHGSSDRTVGDAEWVRACECGWTHKNCIQQAVIQMQGIFPGWKMYCYSCQTLFKIAPSAPILITTLYNLKQWRDAFNKAVVVTFLAVTLQGVAVSCSLTTLIAVYGGEVVIDAIRQDPVLICGLCNCVTMSSVLISYIPWDIAVLHILRRGSYLPVIGQFLPMHNPTVVETSQPRRSFMVFTESLFLQFAARITGHLLFASHESKLTRLLLGGVTFLGVKGLLTMYYRQKIYSFQSRMEVQNYGN